MRVVSGVLRSLRCSTFLIGAAAWTVASAQTAVFRGLVVDSARAQPVEGVAVSLPVLKRSAITDASGTFEIPNLPPGPAQAQLRRLGYRAVDVRLMFSAGDTLDRRFILSSTAPTLDSVKIV